MRFASLGSGSKGNGTLVQYADTTLLVDCGFSAREAEKRAQKIGFDISKLTAIVVTHEHSDHIGGVNILAKKHQLPVYATPGTASYLSPDIATLIKPFNCHQSFAINDIGVEPFPVPHDAREPSQFVFNSGQHRLGLLTDLGMSTPIIEQVLSGCQALMLETNHDLTMLQNGVYPEHLKQRVSSTMGHLNNSQAAEILNKIDTRQLQHLIAMHISEKNNATDIVKDTLSTMMNCEQDWVQIADQSLGFDWRDIA